jgi:hypothetical protein
MASRALPTSSLPPGPLQGPNSGQIKAVTTGRSLWQKALNTLSKADKQAINMATQASADRLALLDEILHLAQSKREQCLLKRWTVSVRDRTIIVRDLMEKTIVGVNRFKEVVNQAVSYDPHHTALPWAAIRFFLQSTVNEVEVFAVVMELVDSIANMLVQCQILEALYLHSALLVTPQLSEALTRL